MALKFNVGDVVINFESLALWDNPYHFKKTLDYFKKDVVVAADDRVFTTFSGIRLEKFSGFSDWDVKTKVCSQNDGRAWDGSRVYVNWTTNEQSIRAYLNNMFKPTFDKCDKADEDEIAKLEAEIAFRQKQLEVIKAGKRPISYNREIIERDFINERKQALLDILNG
jgi:hypothetical protein